MGHTQSFQRRKPSILCHMPLSPDFQLPPPVQKPCECSLENFECTGNYEVNITTGACAPSAALLASPLFLPPPDACKSPQDNFMGPSGWRKIPGDTCEGGVKQDAPILISCSAITTTPTFPGLPINGSKQPIVHVSQFTTLLTDLKFLPNSTVALLLDSAGSFSRSDDEGGVWTRVILPGSDAADQSNFKVVAIRLHDHVSSRVFVLSNNNKLFYSNDFAATFIPVPLPAIPNQLGLQIMDFHPIHADWLLFVGGTQCPSCHSEAFFSPDNGLVWKSVDSYVQKCLFAVDVHFEASALADDSILCTSFTVKSGAQDLLTVGGVKTDNPMQLVHYGQIQTAPSPTRQVLLPLQRLDFPLAGQPLMDFYVFENYLVAATNRIGSGIDLLVSVRTRLSPSMLNSHLLPRVCRWTACNSPPSPSHPT